MKLEFAVLNSYRWAHNVSLCVEGWEPQLLIKFTDGDQQGFLGTLYSLLETG